MAKKNTKKPNQIFVLFVLISILLLIVFIVNYSNLGFNINKYASSERCIYVGYFNQWCDGNSSYECSSDRYKIKHITCSDSQRCKMVGGKAGCFDIVGAKPKVNDSSSTNQTKPNQKDVNSKQKDVLTPSQKKETKPSTIKTNTSKLMKAI